MSKLFIIGLPRTGTTSLCSFFLQLGFNTAHTAYTIETFESADVLADTPIFNDYQLLCKRFINSKVIFIERDMQTWLPSISQLLERMSGNLFSDKGGYNDTIKRCYKETFRGLNQELINDFQFLETCYEAHRARALEYFKENDIDYLTINLMDKDAIIKLSDFLNIDISIAMPHMNKKGKVTAWNSIDSINKVSSTRNGKVDKDQKLLLYFKDVL